MTSDRLYPAYPNAKIFFEYFPHLWDFIVAPTGTKDWQTITDHKLQPRVLWHKFQDVNQILGVRFGKETRYGMVDVDIASLLHFTNNPQAFRDVCVAFESIGLCRFAVIFSSFSEGVHIYFPLPEAVNTFNLACALRMVVESAGFKIKGGQLELFPNTKTYKKNRNGNNFSHFNGHRLPLQPETGSTLLDSSLNPYSQDLEDFFAQMDWAAAGQDMEKLNEVLPLAREWYGKRYFRFTKTSNSSQSKVGQWQEDTETLISEGFTDYGQTNELIREIGKYGRVFLALEGEQLRQYMVETVTNLPGYKTYCRHQPEIKQRCHHWAKIIEPFWWPLGTNPTRHTSYPEMDEERHSKPKNNQLNKQRAEDCLKRLQDTLAYLAQQAIALPQKVGERIKLLCETSKQLFDQVFSQGTLKKPNYKQLWHPKYDQTQPCMDVEENTAEAIDNPEQQKQSTTSETEPSETTPNPNSQSEAQSNCVSTTSLKQGKNVLQKFAQPKNTFSNQSKKKIAPFNVVREIKAAEKSLKFIADKQLSQKDQTTPYMKGLGHRPEASHFSAAVDPCELELPKCRELSNQKTQKDEQQNCKQEKLEMKPKKEPKTTQQNLQELNLESESDSGNINKAYGQKTAKNPPKLDKKNLSESQKHYQELAESHSEWKTFDELRQKPEYQKKIRDMLAEVREMLKEKSRSRRGFNSQTE